MSRDTFQPVPVVEMLVALNPTILVRDLESEGLGFEMSRHGLDSLYFKIQMQKRLDFASGALARAIDWEADGVMRDLAIHLRSSGWDRQVAAKMGEAMAMVRR